MIAAPPPPVPTCVGEALCIGGDYESVFEIISLFRFKRPDGTPYVASPEAVKRLGVRITTVVRDVVPPPSYAGRSLRAIRQGGRALYYAKACSTATQCSYGWAWGDNLTADCAVYLRRIEIEAATTDALARAEAHLWFRNKDAYVPLTDLKIVAAFPAETAFNCKP